MNTKLEKQLAELLEANIITSDTAQKILAFYHTRAQAKPNRLFTIFGVLGALLSGLGIILIIAHNWDDLQRSTKTFLAFLPLIIGQMACAYGVFKNKKTAWVESSATFLILAVGATISLVSQIYNIPGNLSSFLLIWTAITAPFIYLMRSNLAVIIHLVLATWYACDLGYFYNSHVPWWYLLQFAWILPFYISLQKRHSESNLAGILNWILPLSLVIVLGSFTNGDTLVLLMYIALFGLLYNIGQLPLFKVQKLRRNGYTIMGSLGTVFLLTILTFEWFWKDAINESFHARGLIITALLFLSGIAVIGYLRLKKRLKDFNLFQYAFLIIGLLYLTKDLGAVHGIVLTNFLVAGLGLFAVRIGINKSSYGILNYGLLIITVLIVCRFFDTNLDFVFRGILFISVGAGFFFANYLLLKKQRKNNINSTSNTASHE
ncbi:MAG: DUF2157 domain-containing protein [Maribacter sp.]|uniref:DUF2157 domain-containing protein n=1 Tax=Maribacter sp. TaxID=1897614 RepID=UPI00329A6494